MQVARLVLALILLLPLFGSCSDDSDSATQVIIDSDGAFDDIKAILYLLEQPDVKVVALTFSGTGIAHCPEAAENASALLERIDAPQIPVACGRQTPLQGNNAAPPAWRSAADTLGGVTLPEPRPLSDLTAPELLVETINASEDDIVLVALGPLTNIAEATAREPDLLDKVETMFLMGGAVDVGGNVLYANADAEFNIWADPTAAAIVFETGVPITLIPLDATNDVPVTPYLYQAVEANRTYSAVSEFTAEYLEVTPLVGGMYHWDELAAVVATDESVVTLEERQLEIDPGGATVDAPTGRPVRVAITADVDGFKDHFYAAIIGTSDPGIPNWQPDAILTWDGTTCTYEGPDPLPEEFSIRLDNTSDEFMAFASGIYDAGATIADFEAAIETGNPGTPDWWLERAVIGAPSGAHDVWITKGGPSITGLCYIDPTRVWEVAGPRLPE